MRDSIVFSINGQPHEVRGPLAFATLSDYLRYQARLMGTKVVCAEGDCGACAVLVGTPNKEGTLTYRTITSCIASVFQLDGTHVITVEGLPTAGKSGLKLHPVQKAMVENHGTQCGFCTPGIVVALAGMCEKRGVCGNRETLTENEIRRGLTGNLCRCTGYETILQAGRAIGQSDVVAFNTQYPTTQLVPMLGSAYTTDVTVSHNGKTIYKPVTLQAACAFRAENPGCTIISGGTDIGVVLNKGKLEPTTFLSLSGLTELNTVTETVNSFAFGATVSLSTFEAVTKDAYPSLFEVMQRHGSPLIRNAGTLAGNIMNGSPIGDTMPALMALDADLELTNSAGSRLVKMNSFYAGYRKTVAQPDELLTRIIVPKLKPDETLKLYKVSKRKDLDISTFTAAFYLQFEENGIRRISDARVIYGGVGPTLVRLAKTEKLLIGQALTEDLMERAGQVARTEITPISDVRSSADYRLTLAENMPLKLYYDLVGEAVALS